MKRSVVSGLLGLGVMGLAGVVPAADIRQLAPLVACRRISENESRLACFDRESAPLDTPAAPPATAAEKFGLPAKTVAEQEVAAGTREPESKRISAQISGLTQTSAGLVIFMLDNGQVWRQTQSEGDLLEKVGEPVTISRAMLGSFWLQLKSGRGCRVARVR